MFETSEKKAPPEIPNKGSDFMGPEGLEDAKRTIGLLIDGMRKKD